MDMPGRWPGLDGLRLTPMSIPLRGTSSSRAGLTLLPSRAAAAFAQERCVQRWVMGPWRLDPTPQLPMP